jgi:hypothetical protein
MPADHQNAVTGRHGSFDWSPSAADAVVVRWMTSRYWAVVDVAAA